MQQVYCPNHYFKIKFPPVISFHPVNSCKVKSISFQKPHDAIVRQRGKTQAKVAEKLMPNIGGGGTNSSSSYDSQVIIPAPWVVMPSDNTKVNLPIKR